MREVGQVDIVAGQEHGHDHAPVQQYVGQRARAVGRHLPRRVLELVPPSWCIQLSAGLDQHSEWLIESR